MSEIIAVGIHKKPKNGSGGIGLPLKTENFEFTGSKIFTLSEPAENVVLVTVDNIPLNGTAGAPLQYRMNSPTELEILDEMILGEDYWISITFNFSGAANPENPESIFVPSGKRLVFKHPTNDNPAMKNTQEINDLIFGFIGENFISGYYMGGDFDQPESYDQITGS
ncbi:hypothetical protein [Flavobacterium mesophilum]|uniref:hypothetical protein n=1 Tax=Flavobacterium mesophilum TaxID=3143495 RepID=UPI0031DEF4D3